MFGKADTNPSRAD